MKELIECLKPETATITPEERQELKALFDRADILNEVANLIKEKKFSAPEILGWIINDTDKNVKRMKELNAKY